MLTEPLLKGGIVYLVDEGGGEASHPTVRVQQNFLSSLPEELNISSGT